MKKKATFLMAYQQIAKAVPEFSNEYSFLEFIETKLLVKSRTFSLNFKDDDDNKSTASVPWASGYNHGTGTTWFYKI